MHGYRAFNRGSKYQTFEMYLFDIALFQSHDRRLESKRNSEYELFKTLTIIHFIMYPYSHANSIWATDIAQFPKKPIFESISHVFRTKLKNEGISGLYKGCLVLYGHRFCLLSLYSHLLDSIKIHNPRYNETSRELSYAVCFAFLFPLETMWRRYIVAAADGTGYSSFRRAAYLIWKNEGLQACYKGCGMKILFAVAISLGFFEKKRHALSSEE
ncbi:hypothetical protein ACFE04_017875 [Oxalis oulophora]